MITTKRVLSYLIGIATLAPLHAVYAQPDTDQPDKACQTYFCMLDPQVAQDPTCQPLVQDVFNTFPEGTHNVTCGSSETDAAAAAMIVINRKAGKDFCRPDLLTKGECSADAVIDVSGQGALYTRQWKLKVGAPITEYYQGTSVPTYTPTQNLPTPAPGGGSGTSPAPKQI